MGNCSTDWETRLLCSSSSASPFPLQVTTKATNSGIFNGRSVCLSQETKKELIWWVSNLKLSNGKSLVNSKTQIIIASDTLKKGWGVYYQGQRTERAWPKLKTKEQINAMELKAAKFV